jgi:phage gp29-like protein
MSKYEYTNIETKNEVEEQSKKLSRGLTKDIATRDNSIDFFGMFFGALPNPDPILKKQGKDIEAYEMLAYDSRVKACVTSRKSAVKLMDWDVTGDENTDMEIQFHKDYLKKMNIVDITSETLEAVLFGYKPNELQFRLDNNMIVLNNIVGKPQRWFTYSDENKLRFLDKNNFIDGIPVPKNKFVVARSEATYNNPYGVGAYSGCYWPVIFRKNGWKFWTMFVEKYGMPFLLAKVIEGTRKEEIDKTNTMLVNMFQDAVATVPDNIEVEMLAAQSGKSSESAHPTYIDYANTEIAMSLLGQNLTTEVKGGSFAATQGHLTVRDDIVESDATIVSNMFTEAIGIVHRLNFPSPPPQFKLFSEEKIDTVRAERDEKILSANPGFKFTSLYYERNYNFQTDEFILTEVSPDGDNNGGGSTKDA